MSDEACDRVSAIPVSQNAVANSVQGKQVLVWVEKSSLLGLFSRRDNTCACIWL